MALHEKLYGMKIICLTSGGVDSSVMLSMLKKDGHDVIPLFIDYGHKSSKMELNAFHKVCKFLKLKGEIIDITGMNEIKSGLTDRNISAIDYPFFPNRNLLLLSIASAYAFTKAAKFIAIGLLKNSIYPDQRKSFLNKAENTISNSLALKIKILTPFIDLNKLEVFHLAKKYKFPIKLTYSCYSGSKLPCGKCMACISLKKVLSKLNS